MTTILFVIGLSAAGVLGDYLIKLSGMSDKVNVTYFCLGAIIYALTAFGWFYSFKHINISALGTIYAVTTALLLLIIGVTYFHEALSIKEYLGIGLAICSLILLGKFI